MNVVDKELLTLAAKVGKYDVFWVETHDCGITDEFLVPLKPEYQYYRFMEYPYNKWNPLTDDGDAMRLSVKLGLCISHWSSRSGYEPHVMVGYRKGSDEGANLTENYGDDCYAATRRAIVRAAAEIGRHMKEKQNEPT